MSTISEPLLTREQFRERVFERDRGRCVFCGAPAVDAHHILERRLWGECGGYFLSNGASVCATHHLDCESTFLSVEEVREKCGITKKILPPHFYDDVQYDKWGNIIEGDRRFAGELFHDESVQKILLPDHLAQFVKYVKYPRTSHLPWSPGMHDDDKMMQDTKVFDGRRVIVMEKLDGENTTMYNDHIHARSVSSGGHPSRNWIKAFHARICADIPEGWRINVENVYAKHSIAYKDLDTYAYGFAIWDSSNHSLDWGSTLEWFTLLSIVPCPVVYWGTYDERAIRDAYQRLAGTHETEGYVIRVDERFHMRDFRHVVGKYVRKGHIQTTKHWMYGQPVVPNQLKPGLTGFEGVK